MDNPLVQPDPGLFIWTILTFLVLLGLLAKFAWKPLLQALERRQTTMRKALDDAKREQELERLQQDSAQMMRQARVEAEAIIAQEPSDADALREELKQHRAPRRRRSSRTPSSRSSWRPRARSSRSATRRSICRSRSPRRSSSDRCREEDNEALIEDTLKQVEARHS